MYIVAIGWAYVILMVAITASSLGKALAILFFLGVLPLALFVFAFGKPRHRKSVAISDEIPDQSNRSDSHTDQH